MSFWTLCLGQVWVCVCVCRGNQETVLCPGEELEAQPGLGPPPAGTYWTIGHVTQKIV